MFTFVFTDDQVQLDVEGLLEDMLNQVVDTADPQDLCSSSHHAAKSADEEVVQTTDTDISSSLELTACNTQDNDWPDCWTRGEKLQGKLTEYPWLVGKQKNIGCFYCRDYLYHLS